MNAVIACVNRNTHWRPMKQMSAWDLTCRSVTPESCSPSSTQNGSTQNHVVPHLASHDDVSRPPVAMPADIGQPYKFAMGASPGPAQQSPAAATFWDSLNSNKQLQALLATATRAALVNNSNYSIDLASSLDWLQVPSKLDLTRAPSIIDLERGSSAAKLHPMTIAAKLDSSLNLQSSRLTHLYSIGQRQQPSLTPFSSSSASPVSSTGSSCSGSTESINLSLNRGAEQHMRSNAGSILAQSPKRQIRYLPTPVSSSGNSSDADYLAGGDASTSSSAMDVRIDRRARKKDQNRRAAYNYRRKKMEERDRMIEEEARLVHKHVRLVGKIARLEKKIALILNTKTAKIFDDDGHIVSYTCPVCSKHTSENIQTLRNHLKVQHFQHDRLQAASAIVLKDRYIAPSCFYETTGVFGANITSGLDDVDEYDTCTDSDESNNHSYLDIYKECDAKFVINADLIEDNDNNNIKNNQSL